MMIRLLGKMVMVVILFRVNLRLARISAIRRERR